MIRTTTKWILSLLASPPGLVALSFALLGPTVVLRERAVAPQVIRIQPVPASAPVSFEELAAVLDAEMKKAPVIARNAVAKQSNVTKTSKKRIARKKTTARKTVSKRYPKKHLKVSLNKNWKSARHLHNRSVRSRELLERNRFIEAELFGDSDSETVAVNGWQPELEAVEAGLNEETISPSDYSQTRFSEAQVDVELALGLTYAEEVPYAETVAEYEKNEFIEIRERLESLTDKDYLVWTAPKEGPVLVRPKKKSAVAKAAVIKPRGRVAGTNWKSRVVRRPARLAQTTPAPVFVKPAAPVSEPVIAAEPTMTVAEAPMQTIIQPEPATVDIAPPEAVSVVVAPPELLAPEPAAEVSAPKAPGLAPVLAAAAPLPKPAPATAAAALPSPRVSTDPVNTQSEKSKKTSRAVATPTETFDETPFKNDLFARVVPSSDFLAWLEKEKAHFEIYLQPVGSRDPQGTIYLTQEHGQRDFREGAERLRGRYRLVAGIYRQQDIDTPYGEIVYPEEIHAESAKRHHKFFLDTKALAVVSHPAASRRYVSVSLSFFEGAAGEYRQPKSVGDVQVKVVGFPEYGVLRSDDKGDLTVATLPTHSQIVFEVRGKGYYRTFRTVPVFGGDVHVPVYLISKDKVSVLTRALAGVRQVDNLALVMGRVFDPQTRNPLEGETVEVVDHASDKGRYFSFFSDLLNPRTIATGFYSYFNLGKVVQDIVRPEKRGYRFHVLPASAYYVELGRGGMRSFQGRLVDPNSRTIPQARIRLVGDDEFETVSDDKGAFEIPDIDFPSGVISIDVEAEGYPDTRHTVPWNPRQTPSTKDLFLVQDQFVRQSVLSSHSVSVGPNPIDFSRPEEVGNLIAGGYGALFKGLTGCLRAELWSVATSTVVNEGHGPFPFRGSLDAGEKLCLVSDKPGLTYLGLDPGEYLLKWKDDRGRTLGARIVHIEKGRDSILVN